MFVLDSSSSSSHFRRKIPCSGGSPSAFWINQRKLMLVTGAGGRGGKREAFVPDV
jgi:hypothetical protein